MPSNRWIIISFHLYLYVRTLRFLHLVLRMSTASLSDQVPVHKGTKAALLLLDFHRALIQRIPSEEAKTKVLTSAGTLLQCSRQNGAPVVHWLIPAGGEVLSTSRIKPRWDSTWKPLIDSKPEMFDEWPDLAGPTPAVGSHKGQKDETGREMAVTRTPGVTAAMQSKDVLDFLASEGVECLVLAGITTSGAVLSTARQAADMGFVTTVVRDACWDPKPEVHTIILEDVLPMTAWVIDMEKGVELLSGAYEP